MTRPLSPSPFALAVIAALGALPAAAGEVIDCVLAQVNDEIVTLSEYQRQKKTVLDEIYRQRLPDAETQKHLEDARDRALPGLIEEHLLTQKARDLGLAAGKEEVDKIVHSIMEQNKLPDEASLDKALAQEGLTLPLLRANIEKRTLIEKLKQFEIASKIVVTDEEARRYYDGHRDEFKEPERVRLREIVLLVEKRDPDQVKKEIEEIANLVRNGADFAELATLFSQAPTAEHGGDLGLVRAADLAPEIAASAEKLQIGQVSPPVPTKFGFHILKLAERKPVSYRSYEEAHDDIVRKVQESRYGDRLQTYVEELKKDAFIQVNEACKTLAH